MLHASRRGERFGEEQHIRMLLANVPDQPLPEPERLRVRVIDAEDANTAADPRLDDAAYLVPEGAPIVGLEVDRVDVLVLLRRVLGEADRAVGAVLEPLR